MTNRTLENMRWAEVISRGDRAHVFHSLNVSKKDPAVWRTPWSTTRCAYAAGDALIATNQRNAGGAAGLPMSLFSYKLFGGGGGPKNLTSLAPGIQVVDRPQSSSAEGAGRPTTSSSPLASAGLGFLAPGDAGGIAAARSPRGEAPRLGTPRVGTPRSGLPRGAPLRLGTPRLGTPRVGTPTVGTPRSGLPRLGTPRTHGLHPAPGAAASKPDTPRTPTIFAN
ncbi:unnamed protein product [Polarella glacialis]|uniref:Uncharacterized protein n=1 Tax=Polarella glacialis TaxID=89957 RepID=A0A813FQH0_POLGL|nr:unnamed protein product [Polarella glacialis]